MAILGMFFFSARYPRFVRCITLKETCLDDGFHFFQTCFPPGDRAALVLSSCKVGNVHFQCVKQYFSVLPHRVHVWYIFLHLPYKSTKCRLIYRTWIVWVHTLRSDYSIKWYLLTIGEPSIFELFLCWSAIVYHEARRRISYPFVSKDLSKKSASHFGLAYLEITPTNSSLLPWELVPLSISAPQR